jgi:formylglycine-generating enzyme required for sulfatase activity
MKNQSYFFMSLILFIFGVALLSCSAVEEPEIIAPAEPVKATPGDTILVPAGKFVMGTDNVGSGGLATASPVHTVYLPAYHIDVFEVTHGQWMKFTVGSDYSPKGNWRQFYSIGKEDFPVTNVTWEDAKAYCEWGGGRLPTEQEWEKAARGAEGLRYPWGDVWDATQSNCSEMGYRNTIEVGQIDADKSGYGLYDVMGNAQEWTSDKLVPYPDSPVRRNKVFREGFMAIRGGSYALKGRSMGLYSRTGYKSDVQYGIGFRCAKDAEQEDLELEAVEEVSEIR